MREQITKSNEKSSSANLAFTLAEVLITLAIIGVVAALTIPSLIKEYQKHQTESQLIKAYAEITQLFKNIITGEDCQDLSGSGLFDSSLSNADFQNQIDTIVNKYMKIVKTCKNGDTSCSGSAKYLKGSSSSSTIWNTTSKIVFLSAGGIKFRLENLGCADTTYPDMSNLKKRCSWVLVDINADKSPNVFGKDVFALGSVAPNGTIFPDTGTEYAKAMAGSGWETYADYWVSSTGGYHCGEPNKTIDNSSASSIFGLNCIARIMQNNWKIDYWD